MVLDFFCKSFKLTPIAKLPEPPVEAGARVVRHARAVFARSFAGGALAAPDLTVVPAEARFAATFVDPLALSLV